MSLQTDIGLPGLDLWKVVEAGLEKRRNGDPESDWHDEKPDDWCWHASGLADCHRAQILRRAGYATDGHTDQSMLTFDLGHTWHKMFENYACEYERVEPRFQVIGTEVPTRHPRLNLRAKIDMIFSWDGMIVIHDWKSEKPFARKHREEDMKKYGFPYPYRFDNWVQVVAGAVNFEAKTGLRVHSGRLGYLDKSSFTFQQVPVPIGDKDREAISTFVESLEAKWRGYKINGTLPVMLDGRLDPDDDARWKCNPRESNDPRGAYCQCRQACKSGILP